MLLKLIGFRLDGTCLLSPLSWAFSAQSWVRTHSSINQFSVCTCWRDLTPQRPWSWKAGPESASKACQGGREGKKWEADPAQPLMWSECHHQLLEKGQLWIWKTPPTLAPAAGLGKGQVKAQTHARGEDAVSRGHSRAAHCGGGAGRKLL